jgi:hypothetical protein
MRRPISLCILAVALAAATAACETTDFFDTPTGPTPDPVTLTFTGTLTPNGGRTEQFTTQAGGTVTATLVTVSPQTTVGIGLGTWNGVACQISVAQDAALQSTVLIGTASAIGNYCLRIYDAAGSLGGPVTYEIRLVHP